LQNKTGVLEQQCKTIKQTYSLFVAMHKFNIIMTETKMDLTFQFIDEQLPFYSKVIANHKKVKIRNSILIFKLPIINFNGKNTVLPMTLDHKYIGASVKSLNDVIIDHFAKIGINTAVTKNTRKRHCNEYSRSI
jgi:hypothetical protein